MGLFGSDADVSPAIGIQAPRLPLPVFVCVRVSRATNALILLSSEKIRMHRMRYPSEHVFSPVRTTSTLMSMPDRLSRPRMRHPAESVSVSLCGLFQPVCVSLSSV